ncbi:MAG: bacteriohemerythrin [Gammaproteobacteria bacterium]
MNKPSLIVVDDEQDICDIVREIAEVDGFRVLTASSAEKFQTLWQANRPAVLVIDIMLPEMNGLQLLHWLAKEGCYDPIILMSGLGDKAIEIAEMTAEMTGENIIGILPKPLPLDELEALLQKASKKLALMEWTDDMSVGVDALDHDHQKLLRLINELDVIIRADVVSKAGAIESVLSELADYVVVHINREETLMAACGYPDLENHRQIHKIFKSEVVRMMDKHRRDPSTINAGASRDFLRDWWIDHIMGMDKQYASWMEGKEAVIEKANAEFERAGQVFPEQTKQKLKLLIIDDEADICDFVSYVAESVGYETVSINQAEKLQELDISDINIIVLDLFMPGTDGVETIRYLADKGSQAAILLISGHDPDVLHSAQEIAIERGLDVIGSLAKPISYDALLGLIIDIKPPEKRAVVQCRQTLSLAQEELQKAIERREIVPFYQPKVRLATRAVTGSEALARWQHPDKGLIAPVLFIPLFEKHALIKEVTQLMLEQALEQCGAWNRSGKRLQISVNLSPTVLNDLALPDQLIQHITDYNVDPSQLIIEVTESALFDELTDSLDILTRLRMKGFHLSIDDFGTGYSSMQQLMRAPFTELKIDQSFVKHADTDKEACNICESTIELGHKLGMTVIAEGIETEAVWELLNNAGCDDGQGYYMGKPMPAEEFEPWLDAWK